MLGSIIASFLVMVAFAGGYAIISLVRAKKMGASAPHSCTDGCASCSNHCENYNVDELVAEIKDNMKTLK